MENNLAVLFTRLYKNFSQFCETRLQKLDLTHGLFYFLLYIGKHPGCSSGELSQDLNFDTGHTTRSIHKLVHLHYVERNRSETDGRVTLLTLTPDGTVIFEEMKDLFREWETDICRDCSPEQKNQLKELLLHLLNHSK